MSIHKPHPKGFIATSTTNGTIKLHCCDNCNKHHWGSYIKYGGGYYDTIEYDFEYLKPNGNCYKCSKGHNLYDGPEYCIGGCDVCWIEDRKMNVPT